uniref:Metalloendopeptidase n=1 Tax=Strongyloides papillosus TaxID=174720 RepID=A0A0N5C0T6_STREA
MNFDTSSYFYNLEYYRQKRKIKNKLQRWFSTIPVYINEGLNRELIIRAINIIQKETCVRFKLVNEIVKGIPGIRFCPGEKCFSLVGMASRRQFQNIFIAGHCQTVGVIQHEILHALGVDHEHNRIDRDQYVTIMTDNIDESNIHDFSTPWLFDSRTFGLPYDYGSIMHYAMDTFSKNNGSTIIPKHELYKKTIGHTYKLSFIDIKTVNMMYCMYKCKVRIKCFNFGYSDPNSCDRCKCLEGFVGKDCSRFTVNPSPCGKAKYAVHRKLQEIKADGILNCSYHLLTQRRSKIIIKISYVNTYPYTQQCCLPDDCLEVKYWKDKTVTGARFCGINNNVLFYSTDNIDESNIHDFSTPWLFDSRTFGLPYDYGSIMHYAMDTFSKNNGSTIIPKHELYKKTIGHTYKLSFIDIKTVNMMYCMYKCKVRIKCFNFGYSDPNSCDRCKCLEGFVGKDCSRFTVNPSPCGKAKYAVHRKLQEIKADGILNCSYHLLTQRRSKIIIKISYVNTYPYTQQCCLPDDCLEVKYWKDKTVTGARFCGINNNVLFYSKSNIVLVYFRSTHSANRFKITFKKF